MTAQNMNSGPGYMSYEYREVMVPKEFLAIYMDLSLIHI